jgi:hypothetical protein
MKENRVMRAIRRRGNQGASEDQCGANLVGDVVAGSRDRTMTEIGTISTTTRPDDRSVPEIQGGAVRWQGHGTGEAGDGH